jgi:hypothetical protein
MMKRLTSIALATLALVAFGMVAVGLWEDGPLGPPDDLQERAAQLERQRQAGLRRMEARARVVEDVIERNLPLLEAAARFRDLTRSAPEVLTQLRLSHPGCSDDELHCLHVIHHVEPRPGDGPRAAEVAARLRRELASHRERGTLRLPR